MRNKLKTIARMGVLILIGLVLGVNTYLWNARSLTGNSLPMPFGIGAAVVLSGSMEPTIMTDELILVQAQDSYGLDDIVVYQSGHVLVVHRIVDMDGELVTTRGDANNTDDPPIPVSQIKGRVIGHVPNVGAAVRLLKTPAATLTLLAGAVLLVEIPYRRTKKKDDDELEQLKEEIRRLKDEL